jgi:hypothetical protein
MRQGPFLKENEVRAAEVGVRHWVLGIAAVSADRFPGGKALEDAASVRSEWHQAIIDEGVEKDRGVLASFSVTSIR